MKVNSNIRPHKMLQLLLFIHFTLSNADVIQTFFENPCLNGNVSHLQNPYHTHKELSTIRCAVRCAVDVTCVAFSHPPCVLQSAEQSLTCSSHHAADHTFVKQVTI